MQLTRVVRLLFAGLLALAIGLGVPSSAQALAAGSHKDRTMFDVDTPVYLGYDSTLKLYHFRVSGRWRPVCGTSNYCWPAVNFGSSSTYDIGSNDAAIIRFSDAVLIKRMQIRTYDACGSSYYDKVANVNPGSFENAYAGVNDQVFPGYTKTVSGSTTQTGGPCKSDSEPTSGMSACGGGGCATITWWNDLRARSFLYDVWVNPAPSQGTCYDQLYVKGGYTHTWSDTGLTWSIGYPWGVGVGYTTSSGSFTVFQGSDGYSDPDLKTGRLCHH